LWHWVATVPRKVPRLFKKLEDFAQKRSKDWKKEKLTWNPKTNHVSMLVGAGNLED
jgi:hypothetical protein